MQPETVPQSVINMSDVIEVADAEQITGHNHSILIQTPDLSTFVKGTCPEESKWWYNILVQYVKSKVRHHKRNAFLKGQQQKCELSHCFCFSPLIELCNVIIIFLIDQPSLVWSPPPLRLIF